MSQGRDNSWQKVGVVIAALVAIGSVVATHFNGIATAKNYTDVKMEKLETKVDKSFDSLAQIKADVAVIKNILQGQ